MAVSPEMLGRRLRDARTARGITQDAAAEAIGVPRTAIVHFEAGNRLPNGVQVAKLAEFYNRPVGDLFVEDDVRGVEADDVLVSLRVDPAVRDDRVVQEQVARSVALCREAVGLEKLLGWAQREPPPRYNLSNPSSRSEAALQGSQVAVDERKRLGLADGPIHVLADLISRQGIWVSGADLPNEMSGLFLHDRSFGMAILVNRLHPRPRKRFSFGHEYGHAVMDQQRSAIVSTNQNAREFWETRANSFAAAFLMPEAGVRSFLAGIAKGSTVRQTQVVYDNAGRQASETQTRAETGSQKIGYQDVASLARYFGTSYQAGIYRLQDLGIINQQQREALLQHEDAGNAYLGLLQFTEAIDDGRLATHGTIAQDQQLLERIVYLAIEAYRREAITQKRLLQLAGTLNLPGKDLVKLADAARS